MDDRPHFPAVRQGDKFVRHRRLLRLSMTRSISTASAVDVVRFAGTSAVALLSARVIPAAFSVRRMSPISARGFPFSTSISHLRLVPAFFARGELIEAKLDPP